jgi:hypothetical protein
MKRKRPKKIDIYEEQRRAYLMAYDHALIMQESFPSIAALSINMDFENPDWGGNPSPRQQHYNPKDKAFFEIQCPFRECVKGGFDLTGVVAKLVIDRLEETSGTFTCQGWQDRERIGRHQCLLRIKYKITAVYKDI